MRNLALGRTEAEWLVDLLEGCDPKTTGSWRHDMAAEIRQMFGMATAKEEAESPSPKINLEPTESIAVAPDAMRLIIEHSMQMAGWHYGDHDECGRIARETYEKIKKEHSRFFNDYQRRHGLADRA